MAGFSLTHEERVAIAFIAHNDPRDGFVRRTWLEFKTALCGLLQRTRSNGWISVSERLPELGERVMVSNAADDWVTVGSRQLTGEYHHWDGDDSEELHEPTHWMPLPAPPEVK
jgi:hypothetical protein